MEAAVPEIAVEKYVPKLRIRLEVLSRLPDPLELYGIVGDVQGDGVDVPAVQQTDARRSLIVDLQQIVLSQLPLNAGVLVHHVGRAHGGVEGGRTAAGIV